MPIEKRRNRYFGIYRLPRDVQRIFGKTRVTVALKTDDRTIAKGRWAAVEAHWEAAVRQAREEDGRGAPGDARAFWEAQAALATTDEDRAFCEAAARGEAMRANPAYWRAQLAEADTAKDRREIRELIFEEAEIRAQVESRAAGVEYGTYDADALARAERWRDQATGKSVRLADHLDSYIASCDVKPKTADMRRAVLLRFADHFPLSGDITPRALREWIEGLTADNKARATVQRMISDARGFWNWLHETEIIEEKEDAPDPFARLRVRGGRVNRRDAFTPEQVTALHGAALNRGDRQVADLIAVAAFTGARIEEVCALRCDDVIDDALTIRSGKTDSAERRVPIHEDLGPVVVRLQSASADGYLFDGQAPNKYGLRSRALQQRFSELKITLKYPESLTFHSIRKTVASQLHNAGVPEQIAAPLLGHKINTISYGVYSRGPDLETLREVIRKLQYPGMSLNKL